MKGDKMKLAQTMADKAIAKRNYAMKLMDEAEEELIQARMLMQEVEDENKAR